MPAVPLHPQVVAARSVSFFDRAMIAYWVYMPVFICAAIVLALTSIVIGPLFQPS